MLKQTASGIYYIHDYIPVNKFYYHSQEEIEISKRIWEYKKREPETVRIFTFEITGAIIEIVKRWGGEKIGLIAVPPSKADKISAMTLSIKAIENWCRNGVIKGKFGCNKAFCDYSGFLSRKVDIPTSHLGTRAAYVEQKASIECSRNLLLRDCTAFIILDDVTTTETSMNACYDILVEHGLKEQHIKRLAIARTVEK